jgi:phosphatidylserine decarboxylase
MKLPFMPETWSMFLPALAVGWLLLLWGLHSGKWTVLVPALGVLVVAALILNFFRDFERSPEGALGPKEVLSPADGKVVELRVVKEGFYLKKEALQVAIFMNPLNNHVQRAPFDGKVVKKEYHPGEFIGAYDDKADLRNEQAHLVVDLAKRKGKAKGERIVIKQIAGFLCRRVKTTPEVGDPVRRGERIGRILLGSRVDLFLPKGFKPKVALGDQVKAGVTVLGELP